MNDRFFEDFKPLVARCCYRILDQRGAGICSYHESSPGTCAREYCPKFTVTGMTGREERPRAGATQKGESPDHDDEKKVKAIAELYRRWRFRVVPDG